MNFGETPTLLQNLQTRMGSVSPEKAHLPVRLGRPTEKGNRVQSHPGGLLHPHGRTGTATGRVTERRPLPFRMESRAFLARRPPEAGNRDRSRLLLVSTSFDAPDNCFRKI